MRVEVTAAHLQVAEEATNKALEESIERRTRIENGEVVPRISMYDGYGGCCLVAQAFKAVGFQKVRVNHHAVEADGRYFLLDANGLHAVKWFDHRNWDRRFWEVPPAPTFPFEIDAKEVTHEEVGHG